MFSCTKNRNEGTFGCSPVPRTGTRVHSDVPLYQKQDEGTFAKTALLRNRPKTFVSSRMMEGISVTLLPCHCMGMPLLLLLFKLYLDCWYGCLLQEHARGSPIHSFRSGRGHCRKFSAKFPQTFRRISAPFPGAIQSSFRELSAESPQKPLR